jgi:uncharacterized protein
MIKALIYRNHATIRHTTMLFMRDLAMTTANLEERISLWAFFGLAFTFSWLFWLLAYFIYSKSMMIASALTCLGSFGPSVAAAAVICIRGGHLAFRHWLMRCFRYRVGWQWFAVAALLPFVVLSGTALAYHLLGGTLVYSLIGSQVLIAPLVFVGVFFFGGPLGEELGWRGFALPVLQRRYGWRVASVFVGIVWGTWHLPLFYLADTTQSQTSITSFMVMIIAYSVVFAWLFNQAGQSVMPMLALHTAFNAWAFLIPTLASSKGQRPSNLAVSIFGAIAVGLLLKPDGVLAWNWPRKKTSEIGIRKKTDSDNVSILRAELWPIADSHCSLERCFF